MPGLHGQLRLLVGMVKANRPWMLFTTLSRAHAGVFATAAFAFINSSTWQVAAAECGQRCQTRTLRVG